METSVYLYASKSNTQFAPRAIPDRIRGKRFAFMLESVFLLRLKNTKGRRNKNPIEALKNTKNPEGSVRYLTKIPIVPKIAMDKQSLNVGRALFLSIWSPLYDDQLL